MIEWKWMDEQKHEAKHSWNQYWCIHLTGESILPSSIFFHFSIQLCIMLLFIQRV